MERVLPSNKIRLFDVVIIAIFVAISVLVIILHFSLSKYSNKVVIQSFNETYEYNLDDDQKIEITSGEYKYVIEIKDKSIFVSEANCPNGHCKASGKITKSGESIVCLPGKLIIKIVGGGDKGENSDWVVG